MVSNTITSVLTDLGNQYNIIKIIDLDQWFTKSDYNEAQSWLIKECQLIYQSSYSDNSRIVFTLMYGDYYVSNDRVGLILKNLQVILNEIDISNFFVILISSNPDLEIESNIVKNISQDTVRFTPIQVSGIFKKELLKTHPTSQKEIYEYGSQNPIKIDLSQLSKREKFLLSESKVFCMYPWMHLHAWPTGQAFPCCMSEPEGQVGNTKMETLSEIWNNGPMRELRNNMLSETASKACTRCYEQEESGFFSGRLSANKHHGHKVQRILETDENGRLDRFEMTYWDIRFSNLCNLKCRSCGHIFSSSWYQDQAKLAGDGWAKNNRVLNIAGRSETDMWEQLLPHLDYVEQIYFAGGEPLMMQEHYLILEELERRGRFDVRLIYNTNFTHVRLKDRSVFDYWRKFDSVAVGASLDAQGPRAEYIRKGTDWQTVEINRRQMMLECPNVDFYISPTLSIMNALHLPDFHRSWVEQGLIKPQDLNVNILQDPDYLRLDIAPAVYKQEIRQKFDEHLAWLRPLDRLNRATVGFESAINFMNATDNSKLIDRFWKKTHELDAIRNENILDIIPELKALQ
jgi:MoaA/NifB/PqqE/SkfB family radical SAM enzyme